MEWKKLKHYGKLSDKKINIEFNYMTWDGSEKYDIRKWGNDGEIPFKGITIEDHELTELYNILITARESNKSTQVKHTVDIGDSEIEVYDVFGSFSSSKRWGKYVTYTSWGKQPKYDIRSWMTDFSKCGKGVTLSESELNVLIELVAQIASSSTETPQTPNDVVEKLNVLSEDLFI